MADVEAPAYFQISLQNHSPWVAVTSIIFLIHSILAVIAKIVSRLHMQGMKSYDWLLVASTLAAFGETILVVAACKNGLGQHEALITSSQLRRYYHDIYAAPMLFVVSNAFAKASVVFYVLAITPHREIQLACYTLLAIITTCAVSFIFALAFQCELPQPWNIDATCIDRWQLFLVLGILNILTDLALVIIPIMMLWRVQAKAAKKGQVMALFASRIFVPTFTIPQLVSQQGWLSSDDRTWYHVNTTIWTQVVMNVSILTACIPGLKRIIDAFLSGTSLFAAPERYRTTEMNSGSRSYGLRSRMKIVLGSTTNKSSSDTHNQLSARNERPTKQMKGVSGQHLAQASSTAKKQGNLGHAPERSESQRSLTEDAIYRTVDYSIEFEDTEAKHTPSSLDDEPSVHGTGS